MGLFLSVMDVSEKEVERTDQELAGMHRREPRVRLLMTLPAGMDQTAVRNQKLNSTSPVQSNPVDTGAEHYGVYVQVTEGNPSLSRGRERPCYPRHSTRLPNSQLPWGAGPANGPTSPDATRAAYDPGLT